MKNKNGSFGCFFVLLIPIGVIFLCIGINYCLDMVYQKKLDKDTIDVLNYIVTKDYETSDEYKNLAIETFKEKGYNNNDNTVSVLATDDYVLLIKYNHITDLKSFVNLFKIKWIDKDGLINEDKINEKMTEKNDMLVSKYIAKLNEYREPVIEKFKGNEDELLEKEL